MVQQVNKSSPSFRPSRASREHICNCSQRDNNHLLELRRLIFSRSCCWGRTETFFCVATILSGFLSISEWTLSLFLQNSSSYNLWGGTFTILWRWEQSARQIEFQKDVAKRTCRSCCLVVIDTSSKPLQQAWHWKQQLQDGRRKKRRCLFEEQSYAISKRNGNGSTTLLRAQHLPLRSWGASTLWSLLWKRILLQTNRLWKVHLLWESRYLSFVRSW